MKPGLCSALEYRQDIDTQMGEACLLNGIPNPKTNLRLRVTTVSSYYCTQHLQV